jgi:hypothetical protein
VVKGHARIVVRAAFTFPLMLSMRWIVDTPDGWSPQRHIMGYYFWFVAFGWMLFLHRDLVITFGRRWKLNLLVANVFVMPAMIGLAIAGGNAELGSLSKCLTGSMPLSWTPVSKGTELRIGGVALH